MFALVNPFRLEAPKYARKFNIPYTKEATECICNTGTVIQYTVLTYLLHDQLEAREQKSTTL